jgi:hypothetical protein
MTLSSPLLHGMTNAAIRSIIQNTATLPVA